MKIIRVTATFGGKVNTGNYSNVDISVTIEAELSDQDVPETVIQEVTLMAKTAAIAEVEALSSPQKRAWIEAVTGDPLPY